MRLRALIEEAAVPTHQNSFESPVELSFLQNFAPPFL
jgi:hypothetical protein